MPGLKGRLSTVVKSKISKQVDRAENPNETLDYAYQRQVENLQNVKKGIADIATAKKRLALQQQQLGEQGAKLDAQARQAISAGREDLARAALERKQLTVQEAGSLDQQIAQLESEQEKLIESEKQLERKTEQFRSKKEVIKAQYSAAEAQVQFSEAATGVGDSMADVGMATQRALDKTETMKARAQAVDELEAAGTFEDLTALGPGHDDVDRELDQLAAKSAIDDEFARLKAEVDPGAAQSALAAGDTDTADDPEAKQPPADDPDAQKPAAGDGEAPPPE
jgi:phage shock protein A